MGTRGLRRLLAAAVVVTAQLPVLAAVAASSPAAATVPAGTSTSALEPMRVMPTRDGARPARRSLAQPRAASGCPAGSGKDNAPPLVYCGGYDGIGVVTAQPKVYLIYWGSQWGTQGTNAKGFATFTGDPKGTAPVLQSMFAHLGTNSERWSSVFTQYCEDVALGASSCPRSSTARIPYPKGGVLAGVWLDDSSAAPDSPDQLAIRDEAFRGAQHFNATGAQSARSAQFVVLSPTGTHPDRFLNGGGFCAWHSYSFVKKIAYTNLPYQPDAGQTCGARKVNDNAAGVTDGVTLTEAHEYAETLTDPAAQGGWLDGHGWENADMCAWQGDENVTIGDATFALPATWSNDTEGCAIGHDTVLNSTVAVQAIADVNFTKDRAVSLQVQATSGSGLPLSYAATGLPSGLSINASSGLISGTASPVGSYEVTVTVTDSSGAIGAKSFTLRVLGLVTLKKLANQQVVSGKAYTITPEATDSEGGALTFSTSSLPPGMSIDASSGVMSGTITLTYGPIQWTTTLTATNAGGAKASRTFNFLITLPVVAITKIPTRTAKLGSTVNLAVRATDSAGAALTYAARGLPPGLALDPVSGKLTGTPTRVGSWTVRITVVDAVNVTATTSFTFIVAR